MKFHLHKSSILLIFLVINICLAAVVIYLVFSITRVKVGNFDASETNYSFSFLPRQLVNQINLNSRAFIVYDTKSRSIVAGKNEKLRFAPASSAKIMAAIVAMENYDLDKVLIAQNLDKLGSDNSKMKLIEGEQMTVENLLYGMMLPSGNDAALVVAQNFVSNKDEGRGVDGFVEAMNKKARNLKLENTNFVDYDGYDDRNYTTAYDLARLGAYAMKNPKFAKIVGTKFKVVSDISGNFSHNLENLNIFLGKYGVNGIKTGFTDEARGVLVTSINNSQNNYIVVVLGSQDRFLDTKNVIDNAILKIGTLFY